MSYLINCQSNHIIQVYVIVQVIKLRKITWKGLTDKVLFISHFQTPNFLNILLFSHSYLCKSTYAKK